METQEMIIEPRVIKNTTPSGFIESNTKDVTFSHLRNDCIIPVFSKDNECTISHPDFIEATKEAIFNVFPKNVCLNVEFVPNFF